MRGAMALESGSAFSSPEPEFENALPSRGRPLVTIGRTAGLAAEVVLGPALTEAVLQLIRSELQARLAPANAAQRSPWMTPPTVSRLTRVPVKTIRAWARDGRIPKRLKNCSPNPKQQKYIVNVEDVIAAAEQVGKTGAAGSEPLDAKERARARAQEILDARAAKGR